MPSREGRPQYERIGDEAVRSKTGRDWEGWFAFFDGRSAAEMTHRERADLLRKEGLSGWWAQMVTVGWEQARGLREVHETKEGYSATVSRTLPATADRAFEAWTRETFRRSWLADAPLEITTSTRPRSIRIALGEDGTRVDVEIGGKGRGKCRVAVEHRKLADADAVARRKKYWADALERLKHRLSEEETDDGRGGA